MQEILKWSASLSGIVAAFMVSFNAGPKITGYGFALFVFSSLCWIAGALLDDENALIAQNTVLFAINLFGVYRYLYVKSG